MSSPGFTSSPSVLHRLCGLLCALGLFLTLMAMSGMGTGPGGPNVRLLSVTIVGR